MAIVYQGGVAGKICANPECGWKPLSEFSPRRSLGVPVGDGYKSRCRKCANAQSRAEYAANIEKYRDTQRKYVEANKEHYRELKRAHRKAHPEKYAETDRKWKESHREEINAKARERRQKKTGILSRNRSQFLRTPCGRTTQVLSGILQTFS